MATRMGTFEKAIRATGAFKIKTTTTTTTAETETYDTEPTYMWGNLPREIVREILLFRAQRSLERKLKSHGFNLIGMRTFFSLFNIRIFGSFILSCLLDNDDYGDIDMIVSEKHWVSWSRLSKFVSDTSFKPVETYAANIMGDSNPVDINPTRTYDFDSCCNVLMKKYMFDSTTQFNQKLATPNFMCGNHVIHLGQNSDVLTYLRKYEVVATENVVPINIDFLESKDIELPTKASAFDVDQIWWDGEFHFPKSFDLVQFVAYPRFFVHSWTNGLNFEETYEWGCFLCLTQHKKNTQTELRTSLQYERKCLPNVFGLKQYRLPSKKTISTIQWLNIQHLARILKTRQELKDQTNTSRRWNEHTQYTKNERKLMLLIKHRLSVPFPCSDYRKVKTLLRVLHLISKGIVCKNLKDFVAPISK